MATRALLGLGLGLWLVGSIGLVRLELYTLCLKAVLTFKLSKLCQILTDFQNFCTAESRDVTDSKSASDGIRHFSRNP